MRRTGTRKTPTVYKWGQPRQKKANTAKANLIAAIAELLEKMDEVTSLEIPLSEGAIDFHHSNGKIYSLTLTQHNEGWVRKKKE